MYERFFGFSRKPFSVTPDPAFFYASESHRQGLAHLRFAVRERLGFVTLTGEVGTGKTHLVRTLLAELGDDIKSALILNPIADPEDLFDAILRDLGVVYKGGAPFREKLESLIAFLLEEHQSGRQVIIIVDESQNLSIKALERLRLLSNLETAKTKLLQIILVGQPELNLLLALPPLRQLNQRINVRHTVEPFSRKETVGYLNHRLRIAGGPNVEVEFTPSAQRAIYKSCKGIPRLASILADYCLVIAFTDESMRVTGRMAREAIRLHKSRQEPSKPKQMAQNYRRRVLIPATAGGVSFVLALVLFGWTWLASLESRSRTFPRDSIPTTKLKPSAIETVKSKQSDTSWWRETAGRVKGKISSSRTQEKPDAKPDVTSFYHPPAAKVATSVGVPKPLPKSADIATDFDPFAPPPKRSSMTAVDAPKPAQKVVAKKKPEIISPPLVAEEKGTTEAPITTKPAKSYASKNLSKPIFDDSSPLVPEPKKTAAVNLKKRQDIPLPPRGDIAPPKGLKAAKMPKNPLSFPIGPPLVPPEKVTVSELDALDSKQPQRKRSSAIKLHEQRKRFGVQLASFRTMERARTMAERLSHRGPIFVVDTESSDGTNWFRVILGVYETYDEAEETAKDINENGPVNDCMVVQNKWWRTNRPITSTLNLVDSLPRR